MGAGVRSDQAGGSKVASLSPYLLARKGGARPAMRHAQLGDSSASEDDLGWNDLGHDLGGHDLEGDDGAAMSAAEPEVKRQQTRLVHSIADSNLAAMQQAEAASAARRAAFTLRLDEERHLRLRLASTVAGESAQNLVTRALDEFLARHPHIEHLAAQARKPA
jgi:predicted HicB family RNase H-like nuclease